VGNLAERLHAPWRLTRCPYHSRETLPEPKSKRVNERQGSRKKRRCCPDAPQPEMPTIGKAAQVPVPLRRKRDDGQLSA